MGVTGCNSGLFTFKGLCHETDLSAVNDAAQENARFPRAHENARRSCGHSRSPRQGSRPPCRVSLGGSGKFPFSRAQRLDGPHAYAAVFAYKCCSSGRWFQVYVRPGGGSAARLGVVVSKRIMKTAVARNFYKRVARDGFSPCAQRSREPGFCHQAPRGTGFRGRAGCACGVARAVTKILFSLPQPDGCRGKSVESETHCGAAMRRFVESPGVLMGQRRFGAG